MGKITLEDVLNLSPTEVVKKIREETKDRTITKQKEDVMETPALTEVKPSLPKVDKKSLKGLFKPESVFEKGQRIQLGEYYIEVVHVESSSGRVRFKASHTDEVFSLPVSYLTGVAEEFPYKKGDVVLFEGKQYTVVGLNPASKNVVLQVEGKSRYVKIGKITKVVHE